MEMMREHAYKAIPRVTRDRTAIFQGHLPLSHFNVLRDQGAAFQSGFLRLETANDDDGGDSDDAGGDGDDGGDGVMVIKTLVVTMRKCTRCMPGFIHRSCVYLNIFPTSKTNC